MKQQINLKRYVLRLVIPAKAAIQEFSSNDNWIPAFAGMTE
jgi:hypothetical protein